MLSRLISSLSIKPQQQLWITAGTATLGIATLGIVLSRINWPRLIFRTIFGLVAPTKERIWPSDDTTALSPEIRGVAWILLAGPPPPHDISSIRTMMKYFWPNVAPPEGNDMRVEILPTPQLTSQTLLIWPQQKQPQKQQQQSTTSTDDKSACNVALIHVHGGGMIAGTTGTERGLAIELARRLQVPVLSVDYRLIPEVSVEDAVQDVVDAYLYLVNKYPQFTKLSFFGGSAGASHSLLAAIKLKQLGVQPQPTSLVLSSPAPGMEFLQPEDDYDTWNSSRDNVLVDGFMVGGFYQYVSGIVYAPPKNKQYFRQQLHPNQLKGLPPCLITAGSYEVILDGARKLHKSLLDAEVQVEYNEYWKMQHCHFAFYAVVPESSQALDQLIDWLKASWK